MKKIDRTTTLPYSAAEMYQLVNDVARYPEFLPWCQQSVILASSPEALKAQIDIGYSGLNKTFTTQNRMQINKMIEIRLLDGPFKHLEGFWLFEAMSETTCSIRFSLEFEFITSLFNLALEPVFYQLADSMVDAFCERAKQLYRR